MVVSPVWLSWGAEIKHKRYLHGGIAFLPERRMLVEIDCKRQFFPHTLPQELCSQILEGAGGEAPEAYPERVVRQTLMNEVHTWK